MSQAQVRDIPATSWEEANQAYLISEFERIRCRLTEQGNEVTPVSSASWQQPDTLPAITILEQQFQLSPFERDLLLLCAGIEMYQPLNLAVSKLSALPGAQVRPTFGLALEYLDSPHWSALTPQGPLRQWHLIQLLPSDNLLQTPLRIEERLLHFLAGVNYLEPALQALLLPVDSPRMMASSQMSLSAQIVSAIQQSGNGQQRLLLSGPDRDGQKDIASQVCQQLGLSLYALDMAQLSDQREEVAAFVNLWQREIMLLNAALLICIDSSEASSKLDGLIQRMNGLVFIAAAQAPHISSTEHYQVAYPTRAEQYQLWQQGLSSVNAQPAELGLDALASQFRLSASQIQGACQSLCNEKVQGVALKQSLWRHCQVQDSGNLKSLGERIHTKATWDDLILPKDEKLRLRQIANQVKYRLKVYEQWGFASKSDRGLGISALFHGESGTGKTMAAEVLAGELNLELYRIDLASVVSKYIGETEKNLSKVFDAAENAGVILLFDEADALFGKRSDVKDSHDRYANLEISYLLQRMESYPGLSLLTTNSKSFLDPAFLRRIRFVVHFPFPDTAQRQAIWQRIFPPDAPTHELDHQKLAQLNMAGGNIRNIAVMAAFLAAEEDKPISMGHLANAAQQEAAKKGKQLSDGQLKGWR